MLKCRFKNQTVFLLTNLLYCGASSFVAEGYVQAYLMGIGASMGDISLFGTLSSVAALAAYAVFLFYVPKRGYVSPMLWSGLLAVVFPLMLIGADLVRPVILLPVIGNMLYQMSIGFKTSCEFCAIPSLFPRAEYGQLSGRSGWIGRALAMLISVGCSAMLARGDAQSAYRVIFGGAAAALLLSAVAALAYRVEGSAESASRRVSLKNQFNGKMCLKLLPHLLRGAGNAGLYYFVAVSLKNVALSASQESLIVTVGVVGTMLGCFLYMFMEKKMTTGKISLLCNTACAVLGVLTAMNRSVIGFFGLYLLYMLLYNTVGYAVPAGVVYSVSAEDLPFITSVRMFIMNGSISLFIPLYGAMMDVMPVWLVMAMAGILSIAAGILFRIQFTDEYKK